MEAISKEEAYNLIVAHIKKQGGAYSGWYCGIASDWEERLFNEHKVPRKDHSRTTQKCFTSDNARAVENASLRLGCDGGVGGGDRTTVYVYAYLKGTMTNP